MKKKSNYITPRGFKILKDEYDHLSKKERPEILKIIQWAAGNGDRSENADYLYGRKRLREIDSRLRFLGKRLDDAVIIEPTEIKSDKVQFGATVEIEDEDGQQKKYYIVGIDESSPKDGKISWKSPIASSMIGKSVGDYCTIKSPENEYEIIITNISYQPIN